jgi:small conductance mechanosensitive channel
MNIARNILSFLGKKEVYGLAIIIILGLASYKLGSKIIEKIINYGKSSYEKKKRTTIVRLLCNIAKYIIGVLVIFFILDLYGVNTKALFASFGVASAVVGLALQDTLKDFISGIDIILNNYFVVGDIVTYNDFTGEVIEMGLRTTKIKKATGEVLILANRNITEIINISQKRANLIISIPTAYEIKSAKAEKTIMKVIEEAKKIKGVFPESKYLGISELGDSAVVYAISIICQQENQWQIKRDVLRIIKDTYEKDTIKIPYPQIEVHNEERI